MASIRAAGISRPKGDTVQNSLVQTFKENEFIHTSSLVPRTHGIRTEKSDSVSLCLIGDIQNERNEKIYLSNKREPLGKSRMDRGYILPNEKHVYGKCYTKSLYTMKDIIA